MTLAASVAKLQRDGNRLPGVGLARVSSSSFAPFPARFPGPLCILPGAPVSPRALVPSGLSIPDLAAHAGTGNTENRTEGEGRTRRRAWRHPADMLPSFQPPPWPPFSHSCSWSSLSLKAPCVTPVSPAVRAGHPWPRGSGGSTQLHCRWAQLAACLGIWKQDDKM